MIKAVGTADKLQTCQRLATALRNLLIKLDTRLQEATPQVEDARKRRQLSRLLWALNCVIADYEYIQQPYLLELDDSHRIWVCPWCHETQIEGTGRVLVWCQHCGRGPWVLMDEHGVRTIEGVNYEHANLRF